uniref:Uncharacterized protein n=1 Tax=Lepeophtheirus salmonis TaxID=72036 RepID=A0A0K2TXI2_LEPSM
MSNSFDSDGLVSHVKIVHPFS